MVDGFERVRVALLAEGTVVSIWQLEPGNWVLLIKHKEDEDDIRI